jgi:hypothetical protein
MHTRGRYSAADLSTPLAVGLNGPREPLPQPPAYFNEREVTEWRTIVECLGPDFFPRESLALLANYVSISCQVEAISAALSKFKEGPPRDVRRKEYGELMRFRGPLIIQLATLSAKLRLAPSARNDRDRTTRRAGQSVGLKKPWEFGTDLDS